MEVKICGLTRVEEAEYLNEAAADYAGFVFFEKSRRNVTVEKAKEIMEALDKNIKKVGVTVSADAALAEKIQNAGFDILQVHDRLSTEVLEKVQIPIWYAVNIADEGALEEKMSFLQTLPGELSKKIEAIVVDGAEYGSGRPFNWRKSKRLKKAGAQSPPQIFSDRKFVLAGGLNASNVREGIDGFSPDVVDVSSGVENENGKDRKLINEFIRKAKGYE
ncbi:MAG: phosphoribosylanthranilate isomerase [Lachnospiraceae bacterium]|nr:phosphoribosylanthranilate isomerase [Lachnospiraceae bacterium]